MIRSGRWLIAAPGLLAALSVAGTFWLRAQADQAIDEASNGITEMVSVEGAAVVVSSQHTCDASPQRAESADAERLVIEPDPAVAVVVDSFVLDAVRAKLEMTATVDDQPVGGVIDLSLVRREEGWCVSDVRVVHGQPEAATDDQDS